MEASRNCEFSFRLGDLSLTGRHPNGSIIKGKNVYLNISLLLVSLLVSFLIFSLAAADVPKLVNLQGSSQNEISGQEEILSGE